MFTEERMAKPSDQKEIIQIAAIKCDHNTQQEIEAKEWFIKPFSLHKLPPFFVKLTNITEAEVKQKGIEFETALKELLEFIEDYPVWTFNNDYNVFALNCQIQNLANPLPKFTRVKPKLPSWSIDPDKYSSGTLHMAAGIKLEGHVHNALHDVRSMAMSVGEFERKSNEYPAKHE